MNMTYVLGQGWFKHCYNRTCNIVVLSFPLGLTYYCCGRVIHEYFVAFLISDTCSGIAQLMTKTSQIHLLVTLNRPALLLIVLQCPTT